MGSSDARGNWAVTTRALAGGSYRIFARATDSAGRPGSAEVQLASSSKPLVIDTTGPTVASTVFDPAQRSFRVVYRDTGSGMDRAAMLEPSFYLASNGQDVFSAASVSPVSGDRNAVVVRFNGNLGRAPVFSINSFGVTDRAGNELVERTYTTASLSGPQTGGPFIAVYPTTGNTPTGPQPFVPARFRNVINQYNAFIRSRLRG
jgi:hypothetical protein